MVSTFEPSGIDIAQTINLNRLGYSDFQAEKKRSDLQAAGALLAKGDYKGGASSLYGSGNLDEGLQVQKLVAQLDDRALAERQRQQAAIGNFAAMFTKEDLAAPDVKERWLRGWQALKASGVNMPPGSEIPAYHSTALANAKMASDYLDMEMKRRQIAGNKSQLMTVSPGATVFDPNSGKPLYTSPGKPGEDFKLPPGVDKKMAEKAVEVTDTADNILDAVKALKDVTGERQGDGSYRFLPDMQGAIGPQPNIDAWRSTKAMVGVTGAYDARQRLDQAKQQITSLVTSLQNKGEGAISDSERRMYAKLTGDLENAANEKTFYGLVQQIENLTQSIRDRNAARRPIGLQDTAAERRAGLGVPAGSVPREPVRNEAAAPAAAGGKPVTGDILKEMNDALGRGWRRAQVMEKLKAEGYDVSGVK
jgi:hypothetical protein